MNGKDVRSYLNEVCERLDQGRPMPRFQLWRALARVATPAVMSLALAGSGCAVEVVHPAYAAPPFEHDCADGLDNDGNGDEDCADEACVDASACLPVPEYAAPFEEECGDGEDNDGDGDADCADADCRNDPSCLPMPAYAVPFE